MKRFLWWFVKPRKRIIRWYIYVPWGLISYVCWMSVFINDDMKGIQHGDLRSLLIIPCCLFWAFNRQFIDVHIYFKEDAK